MRLAATGGTADVIEKAGIPCRRISKIAQGRPNIRDMVTNGECKMIFNTPTGRGPTTDEGKILRPGDHSQHPAGHHHDRRQAVTGAIEALRQGRAANGSSDDGWTVRPLQEYFPAAPKPRG